MGGIAVPPHHLGSAAAELGAEPERNWAARLLASRLFAPVDSPWGDGVEVQCPAYARALAYVVPSEEAADAQHRVGERLLEVSDNGEAYWETYRLLAGTDRAGRLSCIFRGRLHEPARAGQ